MNKNIVISIAIFVINLSAWWFEWDTVVEFSTVRNEHVLWFPFVFTIIISILQVVSEIREEYLLPKPDGRKKPQSKSSEHVQTIIGTASSVILALSILTALPIFKRDINPYLELPFMSSALIAFLWIFFGVFLTFSSESEHHLIPQKTIRKIKSTALIHALGWAGTCVIFVTLVLKRSV